MAAEGRSLYRVPVSFRRVLMLIYLLTGNPSSTIVSAEKWSLSMTELNDLLHGSVTVGWRKLLPCSEALDEMLKPKTTVHDDSASMYEIAATIFKVVGLAMEVSEVKLIKAEKYREVEDLAKTFFKTTKDHVEKVIKTNWKGFDKTIFQGTLPYVFVTSCFVGSMFLLVDAYKLLYQVEEHSENLEKLQRELNDLYQNKMRPTIRYTEEIINSSDEMIPENILKELIEKFQRMYNELKNILEKTESEKTKIKESQTNAKFLGICSAGVGAAVATTAWMFPPAGAVVAGGYILTGLFSATTAGLAFDSLRTLNEQEKQVKKLLHEIHKQQAELEKKFTEINLAFTEARRQRDLLRLKQELKQKNQGQNTK